MNLVAGFHGVLFHHHATRRRPLARFMLMVATYKTSESLAHDSPEPGLYAGVSFSHYCSVRAVNHSTLRRFLFSPLHVYTGYNSPQTREQKLGEAAHCWLLERPSFWSRYAMYNERTSKGDVRPRKGAHWDAWLRDNEGKTNITTEGFAEVQEISKGVGRHPTAERLRRAKGHTEVVVIWRDPTGLLCKARVDKLIEADTNIALDVKTTRNASTPAFSRSIENYRYDTQGAMYERGWRTLFGTDVRFVLMPIESSPPYAARTLDLGPRTRKNASMMLETWMLRYAACEKAGRWPGYDDGIETIDIGEWSLKGVEEDGDE